MDNERIREICMGMPHVAETLNWGHHLVYWAGDRDIGGKMFAMTDLDGTGFGVLWFHCGAERFHELLEIDGISASPYLAKAYWVTLERWNALRPREIEQELRRAHDSDPRKIAPPHPHRPRPARRRAQPDSPRPQKASRPARRCERKMTRGLSGTTPRQAS